jgi:hypothetical protein
VVALVVVELFCLLDDPGAFGLHLYFALIQLAV